MLSRFALLCSLVILTLAGLTKREDAVKQFDRVALGESVRLGTLYDARTSTLFNGMELFDNLDSIEKPKEDTNFEGEFIYEKDEKSRGKNFGVKASLELDYMSGMVHVKGSAEYLTDELRKSNTIRFTSKRYYEHSYADLNMHAVTANNYCKMVGEEYGPTHFVSRITYGQRVYMTFDKEYTDDNSKKKIEGELRIEVNNIPALKIDGHGKVILNNTEYKTDDKIVVKFYGDAILGNIPTTYKEAIAAYQETSVKINDKGKLDYQSPVKYSLTPITEACTDKEAIVIKSIRDELLKSAVSKLFELKEHMQKVNYLLETDPAIRFTAIRLPLVTFSLQLEEYYTTLAANFATVVPEIRAGGNDSMLGELISSFENEKFAKSRTNEFLSQREREINAIEQIHKEIKNNGIVLSDPVSANDNECIFKHQNVTAFTINALPNSDVATTFLNSTGSWKETNSWVNKKDDVKLMGNLASSFSDYAQVNMARLGDKKDLNCFMVKLDKLNEQMDGGTHLYQDGKLLTNTFLSPDQYDTPTLEKSYADGFDLRTQQDERNLDITGTKVRVEWTEGAETLYSEQVVKPEEKLRVSGLKPGTTYSMNISQVIRDGHGEGYPSERIINCKTLVASKPALLEITHEPDHDYLTAKWSDPMLLSSELVELDSPYLKYKVSYNGEDHTVTSSNEYQIHFNELSPLQKYTFSVVLEEEAGTGETASKDFTVPPNPPSWSRTGITGSSADFSVDLNGLDLKHDQTVEFIILSFWKTADGKGGKQEYWYEPTNVISVEDLEQNTAYTFSCRITVRVGDNLFYSGSSDVMNLQTEARDDFNDENTRNALSNLGAKEAVIDDLQGQMATIEQGIDDLPVEKIQEVQGKIDNLDNHVETILTAINQNARALERSNCVQNGLIYWGTEWGHEGSFDISVTSASSLPDCIEQCANTDNCQSVSLYQDPKESSGKCHLSEKTTLYKENYMFKKQNSRAADLSCYGTQDS